MRSGRIRNKHLLKKVVDPEVAAEMIRDGMTLSTSGYRDSGYPRAFFKALLNRARKGEIKDLELWATCLLGYDIEGCLAETGALSRRLGSHGDTTLRKAINRNQVSCNDIRPEVLPQMIRCGLLGRLDVTIVDAIAITEEGHIIPALGVYDIPSMIQAADRVIVEIDHGLPMALEGMHDVYLPALPPQKEAIPLIDLSSRIGNPYINIEQDKIEYVIECKEPYLDHSGSFSIDEKSQTVAEYVMSFFNEEIKANRLPKNLLPIECGIGNIADSVLKGLARENFYDIEFYGPGITEGMFELIEMGKVKVAQGVGLRLSMNRLNKLFNHIDKLGKKIILRPIEIINNPEIVRRFGIIAINGAIEVDIYGHINSSHIGGTSLINGVGGSGVFSANSYLSIFALFSTGKGGDISRIVPMAAHVDQSEHNVDVIVTEQGLADVRGLSPIERAFKIINTCAHPTYRPLLTDYLERAKTEVGGHEPHLLEEAFSFHRRLKETGSMNVI